MRIAALLLLALSVVGCATYREDLNRGQRLYEQNEYEHALAIWRELEPDADSLKENDQARYAYLRGMTDYRLGFRPDARHWLAIAKAVEEEHPGGLTQQWKDRLADALKDLNKDVLRRRGRPQRQPFHGDRDDEGADRRRGRRRLRGQGAGRLPDERRVPRRAVVPVERVRAALARSGRQTEAWSLCSTPRLCGSHR